jgi:hypothetical protein
MGTCVEMRRKLQQDESRIQSVSLISHSGAGQGGRGLDTNEALRPLCAASGWLRRAGRPGPSGSSSSRTNMTPPSRLGLQAWHCLHRGAPGCTGAAASGCALIKQAPSRAVVREEAKEGVRKPEKKKPCHHACCRYGNATGCTATLDLLLCHPVTPQEDERAARPRRREICRAPFTGQAGL